MIRTQAERRLGIADGWGRARRRQSTISTSFARSERRCRTPSCRSAPAMRQQDPPGRGVPVPADIPRRQTPDPCCRRSAPASDPAPRGTEGSNPSPSSGESVSRPHRRSTARLRPHTGRAPSRSLRNQIVDNFAAQPGRIDRWPRGASENCEAVGNSPLNAVPSAFASKRPPRSCGSTGSSSAGHPSGRKPAGRRDRRPCCEWLMASGGPQWRITDLWKNRIAVPIDAAGRHFCRRQNADAAIILRMAKVPPIITADRGVIPLRDRMATRRLQCES
jgi:hypothetical protein